MLVGDLELLMKETPVTTDIHHWSLSPPPTCSTDSPTMCLFLIIQLPPICGSQLWSKQVLSLIPKDLDLYVHTALWPCLVWKGLYVKFWSKTCASSIQFQNLKIQLKCAQSPPLLCLAIHSSLVKMTALPSFCSAASQSSFLPAYIFFPLFITSSSFVSQAISQSYFWQGNRHSKKELSLMSEHHKNLDEKNRHTGLYLPLSFCNCLFVLFASSPEMENVVLKRSKTQPLCCSLLWCSHCNYSFPPPCVDANSSKQMYCIFPVDMHN